MIPGADEPPRCGRRARHPFHLGNTGCQRCPSSLEAWWADKAKQMDISTLSCVLWTPSSGLSGTRAGVHAASCLRAASRACQSDNQSYLQLLASRSCQIGTAAGMTIGRCTKGRKNVWQRHVVLSGLRVGRAKRRCTALHESTLRSLPSGAPTDAHCSAGE